MIPKIKILLKKIIRFYQFLYSKAIYYWDEHTTGITLSILIVVFFLALFWKNIFISIDSGYQGIRWSRINGTQLDEIYDEGLHLIWPWDKMYLYDTKIQTKNDTMQILTAEGLTIGFEFTCRFYAIRDSLPVIHKTIGVNYVESYIVPEVESASMAIIANYTPEQLYKVSTLVIQSTIKHYLNKQLLNENIILEDYLARKITLPDIVSQSIEKKMVAEQLSYEFDYKLITEEKEKKRKVIEAEGIRKFEEISQVPILKWKGLEVTSEFAKSNNSKIIIMGNGDKDLPLLLNTDEK